MTEGESFEQVAREWYGKKSPLWSGHHQTRELLRTIRGYKGGPIVRAALQLAPMLFQRPTELRAAEWAEFDLDGALWSIQAKRMKRTYDGKENGAPHLVPLPTQAVTILRELHHLTGDGALLFPGERGKGTPISDNTLRAALQTLGYGSEVQSIHGFRATAQGTAADPGVSEAVEQKAVELREHMRQIASKPRPNRKSTFKAAVIEAMHKAREQDELFKDYLLQGGCGATVDALPGDYASDMQRMYRIEVEGFEPETKSGRTLSGWWNEAGKKSHTD